MKRSTKKGFTIVELVIVIAIIAILAAVLIPTFASLIQKANVSKDTQLVRNLNTALVADNAEHKTMQSALDAAAAFGYDVGKINASATGNEILWDSKNDVFCYFKDGKVEYIPESNATKPADYKLWKVYTEAPDTQTYSIYWNSDKAFGKELTVGFDAGKCNAIDTLTYKGVGTKQDVVIRTNGGKLVVDAASDHVEHYGLAKVVDVQAVSEATYVEHGTVAQMTLAADAKNVIIKSTAVVVELDNHSTSVAVEGDAYVGALTENSTQLASGTAGGTTIKVGTYDQLQALALASTIGIDLANKEISLQNDIDASGRTWTPFGWADEKPFSGTINGNGHKITGLSSKGYTNSSEYTTLAGTKATPYALIAYAAFNVTVKDLTLDVDFVQTDNNKLFTAGVISTYKFSAITAKNTKGYDIVVSNVTVNGNISGNDNVAAIMGTNYVSKETTHAQFAEVRFKLENCVNNATIKSENRVGGIVCKVSTHSKGFQDSSDSPKRQAVSFDIINCKNTDKATIETTNATYGVGGIVGFSTNSDTDCALTNITGCESNAQLKAPEGRPCGQLIYVYTTSNKITLNSTVKDLGTNKAYDMNGKEVSTSK